MVTANHWVCAAGLLVACGTNAPRAGEPLDCSADAGLELLPIGVEGDASWWFAFSDDTRLNAHSDERRGPLSVGYENVPDELTRCDASASVERALHFVAAGNNDWGAGFSHWRSAIDETLPRLADGSGYRGLSFWALARGDKAFTLAFNDANTSGTLALADLDAGREPRCEPLPPLDSELPLPDPERQCDNAFEVRVLASAQWQFFRIPWSSLLQPRNGAIPHIEPQGIDRAAVFQMNLRFPKDSTNELWVMHLNWYR